MVDFQSVKSHFDSQNLSYYCFPKSEKLIKAVIRHLPHNTLAEYIYDGLVSLGFDVISVKQMAATLRSHSEKSKIINLPLFLVTLPKTVMSQESFLLSRLCHIAIRVETYRAQMLFFNFFNLHSEGWSPNWVHSARRPLTGL
jgi:hypothetical protein